tara:strand:- start:203 stop:319 length:117 start_codon:yes stop_codon:yes gene_type:complete
VVAKDQDNPHQEMQVVLEVVELELVVELNAVKQEIHLL